MESKKVREILSQYETPLYCFDIDILKERIQYLRNKLPDRVRLCYAAKANTFIIKEIVNDVDCYEICSPGELKICDSLSIPMEKIVLSGVYKKESDIEYLIKNKYPIGTYTVESLKQFLLLGELSKLYHRKINVLLRYTSGSQFGLNKDIIHYIVENRKDFSFLDIRGIQYFSGTQKQSVKRLQREINKCLDLIKELKELYGYNTEEFEFGPGLPVEYFSEKAFDEEQYLHDFSSLLESIDPKIKITLEMGRTIAASCGYYLTRVVDTKTNNKENYAIVDGGIHQLVYYGQAMAMKIPEYDVYHMDIEESGVKNSDIKKWNICGALCTVNDILVKQIEIDNFKIGDALVFKNTGAYCPTEGMSLFLTRDLPEVILTDKNNTRCVRKKLKTDLINMANYNLI